MTTADATSSTVHAETWRGFNPGRWQRDVNARFFRTPEYDDLFAGAPTWVTGSIGGMGNDVRSLITKTSFRFLQTLYNLGPAPAPNLLPFHQLGRFKWERLGMPYELRDTEPPAPAQVEAAVAVFRSAGLEVD